MEGISKTPNPVDDLTARFVTWAQAEQDVRGIINVGSRARAVFPADSVSDLDILVLTTDPRRYLTETAWFEGFGEVMLTFVEETAIGQLSERRVLYQDGTDVDFSIVPNDLFRLLIETGLPVEMQDLFRRGFQVLVDKDELLGRLTVASEQLRPSPTSQEFNQHLNDFLYHAVWTAKKLRRGELWVAMSCCDGYMKRMLLRMIEWNARAIHGTDYDTWFDGRFLERWADAEVVAELAGVFARYDSGDVKNALLHMVRVHERLSKATGTRLGYKTRVGVYSETVRLIGNYLGS